MAKKLIILSLVVVVVLGANSCRESTTATAIAASLTLNSDGSCTQKDGSGNVTALIPVSKGNLDTVAWTMPGAGGATTQPKVTFPSAAPFSQSSYSSGSPTGSAVNGTIGSSYTFSSVQVWNANSTPPAFATCSNPQAMGVRIVN